jgi:hypothetical protein
MYSNVQIEDHVDAVGDQQVHVVLDALLVRGAAGLADR